MSRHARKGRNPGPVDEWLDTLGYYRKNIAYDETCMFRAASEQLFACQLYHEQIRKKCIEYGRQNFMEFEQYFMCLEDWQQYLVRLEKHMAVCGEIEMQLLCKTFKRSITMFDGLSQTIKELITEDYPLSFLFCHMGEDHYDVVYDKEYIVNSGFTQSIVYKILYEKVFNIPQVTNIVETMLYQKPAFLLNHLDYFDEDLNNNRDQYTKLTEQEVESCIEIKNSLGVSSSDKRCDYEYMLETNIAPFPFKVAKALDPTIYRNIEYDTWTEMRKEMRLGDWYYGDKNFIRGSGCLIKQDGVEEKLHCYIQEIVKNENRCVVYVTSLAQKRSVNMADLEPEIDAKPWPLPYRFSKNLTLQIPNGKNDAMGGNSGPSAGGKGGSLRKRREKKRTTSKCSAESTALRDAQPNEGGASAFEGTPLQMQLQLEHQQSYEVSTNSKQQQEVIVSTSTDATAAHVVLTTPFPHPYSPNITTNAVDFAPTSWEFHAAALTPQTPQGPPTYIWPAQAPPTTPNAAPVPIPTPPASGKFIATTPTVYEPRFYYPPDASFTRYAVWNNTGGDYTITAPTLDLSAASAQSGGFSVPPTPNGVEVTPSPEPSFFYYTTTAGNEPLTATYASTDKNAYVQPPIGTVAPPTVTPMSPQVLIYPQSAEIYAGTPTITAHPPPGTPVILPNGEIGEIVHVTIPPPPPMTPTTPMASYVPGTPIYSPAPMDYTLAAHSPYMFVPPPPTPPMGVQTAAWATYPPGINSQGFIFPPLQHTVGGATTTSNNCAVTTATGSGGHL